MFRDLTKQAEQAALDNPDDTTDSPDSPDSPDGPDPGLLAVDREILHLIATLTKQIERFLVLRNPRFNEVPNPKNPNKNPNNHLKSILVRNNPNNLD